MSLRGVLMLIEKFMDVGMAKEKVVSKQEIFLKTKKNCALSKIISNLDSAVLLDAVQDPQEKDKEKQIIPQEEYEYRKDIIENISDTYGCKVPFKRLEREHGDGTRVKIHKESEFSHQNDGEGALLGPSDERNWFRVRFDDGYENVYKMSDLVVLPKNEQEGDKDIKISNEEVLQSMLTENREDFITNIATFLFAEIQKNKDLREKMFPNSNFRKGDDIIMNKAANGAYNHSHQGSTGKVIRVSGDDIIIRFNHITGSSYSGPKNPEWEIAAKYMTNLSPSEKKDITLDDVKNKISEVIRSVEINKQEKNLNKKDLTTQLLLKENFLLPGDGEGNYVLNYREMTKFVAPDLYAAYGNKDIYGETDMCAPPSECHPNVLKFELSSGCDYNRCTYCDLYKNVKYRPRTFEKFKEHADKVMNVLGDYKHEIERAFIGGGNALGVDQETLEKSLTYVNDLLDPRRIAMYARTQDINRKGEKGLQKLNYAGLTNLYRGVETGSDEILKYVKKGTSLDEMLKASKVLSKTDINLSVTLMPGIGGKRFDEENVKGTVKFLNATDTQFITFMAIVPSPGSEYDTIMKEELMKNTNRPMTNVEVVRQIKAILQGLEPKGQKIGMYGPEVHEVDYNPFYFKITFDRDGKREAIRLCDEYLKTHVV